MGSYRLKGNRNKGDILPRIREFHDALFEHYRETMSGDRNLLFRMKDLWSYMLAEVLDSENSPKRSVNRSMCRNIWRRWRKYLQDGMQTDSRKGGHYAVTDQTKSLLMDRYL